MSGERDAQARYGKGHRASSLSESTTLPEPPGIHQPEALPTWSFLGAHGSFSTEA